MDYDNPQFTAAVKKISYPPLENVASALQAIADGLHKQNEAVVKATDAYQERQYSPTLRAHLHIPIADKYKQETEATKKRIAEFWKVGLEVFGILIVLAYTTISAFQWQEARKATIFAGTQAHNSTETLNETQKQFQLDERAWVGIDFPDLSAVRREGNTIKFFAKGIIKNTGKTPAFKVSHTRTISITKEFDAPINYDREWEKGIADKKKADDASNKIIKQEKASPFMSLFAFAANTQERRWSSEGGVIAPNSTTPLPLIDIELPDPNLDQRFAKAKPQYIYWIGRLTYRDVFTNRIHTTKFCIWYAQGFFELCPGGNSMD